MRTSIAAALPLLLCSGLAIGADFTVTSTSDGGAGSLRQAILDANANPGGDTISFDIAPSGLHTIQPSSPLPAIVDAVLVDGTTQPGFVDTPIIEIDGSLAGAPADGLTLSGHTGSTVRGLVVNRFHEDASNVGGRGIFLDGGGQHVIVGNFLGTDPTGTMDLGNDRYGVACSDCDKSIVGGTTEADRNLLSGNDDAGVLIQAGSDNVVIGNYIGTDVSGTSALPGNSGVFILAGSGGATENNQVGGPAPGEGNLIVANGTGVSIGNIQTAGTVVMGNLIGSDVTGTTTLGNMSRGVFINSAPASVIGGSAPGAGNLIVGASGAGVDIGNFGSDDTVVQGNVIGTDVSGTIALPNGTGVRVGFSASGSPVGATIGGPGAGNRITHNTGAGVIVLSGLSSNPGVITSPIDVEIRENVLTSNGGLGIDLENDGITPNDPDDTDDGANGLQNAPVLLSATAGGGTTTIDGTLDSVPQQTFTLEFFTDAAPDPSGAGEGEVFLGSAIVMTDVTGHVAFSEMVPGELPGGAAVSATATDAAGNTSEFGGNVVVGGPTTTTSSTTSTTSTTTSTATTTSTTTSLPVTTTTTSSTSTSMAVTSTTSTSVSTTTSTIGSTSTTSSSVTSSTVGTSSTSTSSSSTSITTHHHSSTTTSTIGTSSTSTSTTSSTSTTVTTVPPEIPLAGAKLLLKDHATKPQKRRLRVLSKDEAGLALGDGDAVQALADAGGSLRVVAVGGDDFDTTYPLDAGSWQLLRQSKPEKGLRYRASGPITAVVVKSGKRLVIKGKGDGLGHSLATEPTTVFVELRLGAQRFCLAFGGDGPFKAGKKLLRRKADADGGCPDPPSRSATFPAAQAGG